MSYTEKTLDFEITNMLLFWCKLTLKSPAMQKKWSKELNIFILSYNKEKNTIIYDYFNITSHRNITEVIKSNIATD